MQEKQVKRKMQEEFVKALYAKNGVPLTIAEHNSIISQLKSETERARKEISEAMGLMPKSMSWPLPSFLHLILYLLKFPTHCFMVV